MAPASAAAPSVRPPTIKSTPAPAAAPAAIPLPTRTPRCLSVSGLNKSSPQRPSSSGKSLAAASLVRKPYSLSMASTQRCSRWRIVSRNCWVACCSAVFSLATLRRQAAQSISSSAIRRRALCLRASRWASWSVISRCSAPRECSSSSARLSYKRRSPSSGGATLSKRTSACRPRRARASRHSGSRCCGLLTKLSTGSSGLPQLASTLSSSRYLASTGSRASITYSPASEASSWRNTLASCSKRWRASLPSRKRATRAGPSRRSPGWSRRSR
ncbi:hypothetical protein PS685_04899 [Pseudomonas fluorescens]|uniref:Uncharacterized protein n=1 Tax=Pseudomonas fluorescens TaxID=294 RepID=A0A5E6ZVF0_PSEFL|nr:hypothetical protein PS685_04899 [Pseudomonas fluorescens]